MSSIRGSNRRKKKSDYNNAALHDESNPLKGIEKTVHMMQKQVGRLRVRIASTVRSISGLDKTIENLAKKRGRLADDLDGMETELPALQQRLSEERSKLEGAAEEHFKSEAA